MLHPRESRELQLMSHTLKVSPDATIAWAHDVSGNAVATASFSSMTDRLRIVSTVELNLTGNPWPIFNIAATAINYSFFYSNDDRDIALLMPVSGSYAGAADAFAGMEVEVLVT